MVLMLVACGGARSPELDGVNSVSSNSFISWQYPSAYEDQTPLPLSDIAGYHIYIGTTEKKMRLSKNIYDPTITKLSLDKVGKGVHYIAVSCYDVYGAESKFSSIIIVNII